MEQSLTAKVDNFVATLINSEGNRTKKVISKSEFDRTYIGLVVDRYPNSTSETQTGWQIYANASTYSIPYERCNISQVGQTVKLYIPNNNKSKMYAEVETPSTHPDKVVLNDETNTITEIYKLPDQTIEERIYTINYTEDNGEIIGLTYPDGSVMNLEGF